MRMKFALIAFGVTALGDALAQQTEGAPICTDRPTKANAVCTVPRGVVQIELDTYNRARSTFGAGENITSLVMNTTFKFGLTNRSDIEVNWAPHIELKIHAGAGVARQDGVGDLVIRYKHRISDADGPVGFSLVPFIKVPTAATGIGNNKFEGGIAAPVSVALAHGFTLTLGPELDFIAESDGTGQRLNIINLINVSRSFGKLAAYAEFWTANDAFAEGGLDQRSADFAVAYLLAPRLQIDAGVNLGLNSNTPDVQSYAGISYRF